MEHLNDLNGYGPFIIVHLKIPRLESKNGNHEYCYFDEMEWEGYIFSIYKTIQWKDSNNSNFI